MITELCRKSADLGKFGIQTIIYNVTESDGRYGVGITVAETGEWDAVADISPSEEIARRLAETLAANTVTPMSLRYIIEDWLE